jgi:hypothetical protein
MRCGRSPGETFRPGTPAGGRFVTSSACWGSANGSLAAWPDSTALLNDTSPSPTPLRILMLRCGVAA